MSRNGTTEFCLLLSSSCISTPEVANLVAKCFSRGHPPNAPLQPSETNPYLSVRTCQTVSDGIYQSKHSEHFLLITLSRQLILECASSIVPKLKNDVSVLERSVDELSVGQVSWLSELALKSYVLDMDMLVKLVHATQSTSAHLALLQAQHHFKPTLLLLEQMNVVSEVVLCHDIEQLRSLWSNHYQSPHLFPDAPALRGYFGDSIGFYFNWMQTYCLFLLGPTVAALLCHLISLMINFINTHLSSSPDEPVPSAPELVIRLMFTLLMIIWALVCTKLWSRQHATLVECWSSNPLLKDTTNDLAWSFRLLDQRPGYHGLWRESRITGQMEVHFPAWRRRLRYLISSLVIVCCLLAAGFVHIVLLNLEGYVTEEKTPAIFFRFISRHTFHGALFDPNGPGVLPYIPGVLHSLLVFVMNQIVFHSIAKVLTEYENHQSWEEYDRALIIKRFLFEMLDAYGCLAYLGFVLSDSEALRSLLLTMLLTDSLRRFVIESLIPLILYQFRMWHEKCVAAKEKRAADCDTLPNPTIDWSNYKRELCAKTYEPFDDYLEMVLQHGYLVLFAYVCPLLGAPIALVSTFFEAHSDAFKMLRVTRRPSPRLLIRGSFIWLVLLGAQAWLSILTNVGLFVSFLHTHLTESDTDLSFLFLILEHGLFVVAICIHFFIQDVPSVVRDARRSREFRRVNLFSTVPNAT
ncbi:hypothetical protein CRM22_002566 [Opisthorchis felineus]|uniref:Anoctamin n=1 Tax=Opisthorchis felineus TaxID=147828 RepID=A0A4S2M5W3_OPIFE|nr:hypothetical protein CRM22_002566 [Opisthorchis felineus]